jgi:hypothetical protein
MAIIRGRIFETDGPFIVSYGSVGRAKRKRGPTRANSLKSHGESYLRSCRVHVGLFTLHGFLTRGSELTLSSRTPEDFLSVYMRKRRINPNIARAMSNAGLFRDSSADGSLMPRASTPSTGPSLPSRQGKRVRPRGEFRVSAGGVGSKGRKP